MTFAVDFVGTELQSGTKTYNLNFCTELEFTEPKEEIHIYLTKNYYKKINGKSKKNPKINYIIKPNFYSISIIRLFWMQIILAIDLKLKRIEKLFSPMNICPILSNYFRIKVILGLHSNLPWVYFNLMPGNFIRKLFTKKLMEISINQSKILIVNSKFAKEEIVKILRINENKISVIYLGANNKTNPTYKHNNFLNSFNYSEKFILSVLSCVKYHNILNLLKAYKNLIHDNKLKIKLVLIMQILDKKYYKIILQYIKKNFNEDEIIIIKNLEKRKLDNFYKYSQLYIFTSYCEVFGLTSLEAMSNGAPVLISNRSALPEVNKDAALYFDPDDIKDTGDKMLKILSDKTIRDNLVIKGKKHVKKFNWNENVNNTLKKIYDLK